MIDMRGLILVGLFGAFDWWGCLACLIGGFVCDLIGVFVCDLIGAHICDLTRCNGLRYRFI